MSNQTSSAAGNPNVQNVQNGPTTSSSLDMDVGFYNKNSIEQTLTFLGQITSAVQTQPYVLNAHPSTTSNNTNASSTTCAGATTSSDITNAKILHGPNVNVKPTVKATSPMTAPNSTIPAPCPSTASLTVDTTNDNFQSTIAASGTQTTPELSPTSAALSTAAAVAAISSCFTNNNTTDSSVSMNAMGKASSNRAEDATNSVPIVLPLPLTPNTFQNSNNSSSNNLSSQTHSTYQHQLQQLQLSSANTSSSNTPCPTPAPVITLQTSTQGQSTDLNGIRTSSTSPPQGHILPQHASTTVAKGILPQNQLTNVHHLGAMMTNTLHHQQPNFYTPTMGNLNTSKKSSNRKCNSSSLSSTSSKKSSTSTYNPSATAMQMSMSSNVFGNMPLRRGKWTPVRSDFC